MTHTSTEQPEALRLAEHLEKFRSFPDDLAAAAELRRLHARVQELEASQARVPMKEIEILQAAAKKGAWLFGHVFEILATARAVEEHHGITQEKQG